MNQEDSPIILGLSGKAGTGKTTIANMLAPKSQFSSNGEQVPPEVVADLEVPLFENTLFWDHRFFAMPLYQLVSIRQGVEGNKKDDRILYQIHETLVQLFSGSPLYGAPPYGDLVDLTMQVAQMDLPVEGKPRKFLQDVGMMCRDMDEDCFVKHTRKSIYQDFMERRSNFNRDQQLKLIEDPDTPERIFRYICIVSDVRMDNEAAFVHNEPNGVLIRFDASPEVRNERLIKRDGKPPTNLNHITEELDIKPEYFDHILDTDTLNTMDQALDTRSLLYKSMKG